MRRRSDRSGFSLIEALVVLAIGGMALAIIFSIGIKAGDTGFGLGRRALSVADADIAASDLRSLIRSIALRPARTAIRGLDTPISGTPSRLEADVVLERATQCAPQGWAGRLTLTIEPRGGNTLLTCRAGEREAVLMDVRGLNGVLSYSSDGLTWSSTYAPAIGVTDDEAFAALRSETLWVRFAAGAVDVVEQASSGRPEAWVRSDAPL